MPFTINWEEHGVVRTFHGIVDIGEVLKADEAFYGDLRSDKAKYQITDFTQGTPGVIDENLVEDVAIMDLGATRSIPRLKVAFVAQDPYVKGLCEEYIRISQEAHSTWEFKVFDDMKGARNWVSSELR